MARRTGTATLPLHRGRAPRWLFERMTALAPAVVEAIVLEHGTHEVLRRLSDPHWFQAFGCVLGFDWHSSGVTTTVCGALKAGLEGRETDTGLRVAGGKGRASRRTPLELLEHAGRLGLDGDALVRSSRLSAKVDSAAVQDGFQLYHHAFFLADDGAWAVVQQGMRESDGSARRYHWLQRPGLDFTCEPHAAVASDRVAESVLNLVAAESAGVRHATAELARTDPASLEGEVARLGRLEMPRRHWLDPRLDVDSRFLRKVLLSTYRTAPADFEGLLEVRGVGAKGLRALALLAEVTYGETASVRDPARFSFAHGGKDGFPFPVDRATYDGTIAYLREAVARARMGRSERVAALKRLARFDGRLRGGAGVAGEPGPQRGSGGRDELRLRAEDYQRNEATCTRSRR